MFYGAKNKRVAINNTTMDYITFGKGDEILVILPGLGDGLKTVKGTAIPFALMYRKLAGKYRVYVFSRKNVLEKDCTTKTMADDLKLAFDKLGIERAYLLGVSMGGMIAQHFACEYPERVMKLSLVVTAARSNEIIKASANSWIDMASKGDHKSLMIDNVERIYTEKYIRKKHYRMIYPFVSHISKPKSYERFILQAKACMTHDAYDKLKALCCPTLVFAGGQDKIIGKEASIEPSTLIKDASLILHEELGHGLYEESKTFFDDIISFFN